MKRIGGSIALALGFILASHRACAQQSDTLSAAQRAGLALARLGAGQRVRLRASGVGLVEGWVVSSSPNLVALRTDGSRIDVPAPQVDSLWVRGGSHVGSGALIGAGVLGALGVLTSSDCSAQSEGPCGRGIGAVVGAVGGALIGALIGAAVPKWQLRVP